MQSPRSQRLNKPVGASLFCPFSEKPMEKADKESAASHLFRTALQSLAGSRGTGSPLGRFSSNRS